MAAFHTRVYSSYFICITGFETKEELKEELLQEEIAEDQEMNEAPSQRDNFESDIEFSSLTESPTAEAEEPALEDVLGSSHLDGFSAVQNLATLLLQLGEDRTGMLVPPKLRSQILEAWPKLEEYDKHLKSDNFAGLYFSRFRGSAYGRKNGNSKDAAVVQNLRMQERYTPAKVIDENNRLGYLLINMITNQPGAFSKDLTPDKKEIVSIYSTIKAKVSNDFELSSLSLPLQKINDKVLSKFLKKKEKAGRPKPRILMRTDSHIGE